MSILGAVLMNDVFRVILQSVYELEAFDYYIIAQNMENESQTDITFIWIVNPNSGKATHDSITILQMCSS